eukprot:2434527-Alexandrium_andersonii.AAC.1
MALGGWRSLKTSDSQLACHPDSSAAVGICRRRDGQSAPPGSGPVVGQHKARSGDFEMLERPGAQNLIDIPVKAADGELIDHRLRFCIVCWKGCCAASARALDGFGVGE